ncbi:MAG: nuclear transport factor 2 family protein [Acidimicrobiia bacterium]
MSIRRSLLVTVTLVTFGLVGGGFAALASGDAKVDDAAQGRKPLAAGAEFIHALADRDFDAAQTVIAPDIEFKGHTPSMGFVELKGSEAVMSLMKEWYATAEALESLETNRVLARQHVGYRVRWIAPEGPMVFEQQAYYDVDDGGRISHWQFVCTGDQPVAS